MTKKRGVVYTKEYVVELILDLAGYTADRDLSKMHAVEPASGEGAFLLPMVDRLLYSAKRDGTSVGELSSCILAYELETTTAFNLQANLISRLIFKHNVPASIAKQLADAWVHAGDYLFDAPHLPQADFVIGNPPYIRPEDIDSAMLAKYRRAYSTMVGRADVYVAFFEAALRSLRSGGISAFICADRWMSNQYGAALREFVTDNYRVEAVIEMHEDAPFADDVSAYPSVTVIRHVIQDRDRELDVQRWPATVRREPRAEDRDDRWRPSRPPSRYQSRRKIPAKDRLVARDPWPVGSSERLRLLERLEAEFPLLEDPETATRITIGVATGADQVLITTDANCAEESRLLPLALAGDTVSGELQWSGHYLVNAWDREGLVNLSSYPRLQTYLHDHADRLRDRHVARKYPEAWYRTIDRVHLDLLSTHKLYIPDIKSHLHPVLDRGETYPHHNLYVVASAGWDLEVLGGLLLSEIAQFFVESYSVRLRGGYLRFQAQYLRKIRVPSLKMVSKQHALDLANAFRAGDRSAATELACQLYGIKCWPLEPTDPGL